MTEEPMYSEREKKHIEYWYWKYRDLKKELISEFLEDLKLNHPMVGFKYTRKELIEKYEGLNNG